jgi:uncharacterized protein
MNKVSQRQLSAFVICAACLIAVAGSATPADAPDTAYVKSFEKWKAEQTEDLKQNWLSLVGLFWLKPGVNTFGSGASNAMVFPKGPAHAGEFDLQGNEVTLKLQPDTHATIAGKPVVTAKLDPDTSEHVTRVEMGSLRFHAIVRDERVGIRVRDAESEAARDFKGMMFFPLDLDYRTTAIWLPSDGKKTVQVPNALGDVMTQSVPGTVVFKLKGQDLTLTSIGGDAKNGLFFVFSDATAKAGTYPGGRFMDTDPVVDGKVVLDFNRAYSPPCAVTPFATCPLAPKENRLTLAIPAGEKFDNAAHAHH